MTVVFFERDFMNEISSIIDHRSGFFPQNFFDSFLFYHTLALQVKKKNVKNDN